MTVQFTDLSSPGTEPITSWEWNFGDGGSSTEPDPSHTYETEGEYGAALKVTTALGSDTRSEKHFITVFAPLLEPPTAAFTANVTEGLPPLEVRFTDQSQFDSALNFLEISRRTAWHWDFGDGATSSMRNPTHTYQTVGPHTVSLTVSAPEGTDTHFEEDYVSLEGTRAILLPSSEVPMEFVWISPGTFMMGSPPDEEGGLARERPQHQVTLESGFWLTKYPVTKRQLLVAFDGPPWWGEEYVLDHLDSPAVYVSWDDARDFLEYLNNRIHMIDPDAGPLRLPTEAEWEYAVRAGTTTRFFWGDDPHLLEISDYAWWRGNAWNMGMEYAPVVGQKLPNPWGLYDMIGNVWEFVEDDWHSGYEGAPTDGSAWVDSPRSDLRVVRGGHFGGSAVEDCRSASRRSDSTGGAWVGFRVAW